MSFNDDVQLDTSQVESGGGGGGRGPGGMVIGGGLGGIILLIVALIFGINPSDLPGTGTDTGSSGSVESAGDQSRTLGSSSTIKIIYCILLDRPVRQGSARP